ncbi:MAG: DMT family protein [Niabella sp.]
MFFELGIALFEYLFMIPANKIGFNENGGPFNIMVSQNYSGGNYTNCIFGFYDCSF